MKNRFLQLVYGLLITGMMAGLFSCSSSRMYKNYTYTPKENAPDMGGIIQSTQEEKSQPLMNEPVQNQPVTHAEIAQISISPDLMTTENKEKIALVQKTFKEELAQMQESGETASNKELIKKVTSKLTETGQINQLSHSQEKKLNKLAVKMDKKLKKQGDGIDWRHNSSLELFFMIMSIAGLVLGIVGIAFGWFVFIVFGGLWLYWKLVQDKK
jgi:hypothetical protein